MCEIGKPSRLARKEKGRRGFSFKFFFISSDKIKEQNNTAVFQRLLLIAIFGTSKGYILWHFWK